MHHGYTIFSFFSADKRSSEEGEILAALRSGVDPNDSNSAHAHNKLLAPIAQDEDLDSCLNEPIGKYICTVKQALKECASILYRSLKLSSSSYEVLT